MKPILILLASVALCGCCHAYDLLCTINFQSSTNGSDWMTFGTATQSLDSTNAPSLYLYGWSTVSSNQPMPGFRFSDFIVLQGTNVQNIDTPFLIVSNFPFIGDSNTIYRPNCSIQSLKSFNTNDYDGPPLNTNAPPNP